MLICKVYLRLRLKGAIEASLTPCMKWRGDESVGSGSQLRIKKPEQMSSQTELVLKPKKKKVTEQEAKHEKKGI